MPPKGSSSSRNVSAATQSSASTSTTRVQQHRAGESSTHAFFGTHPSGSQNFTSTYSPTGVAGSAQDKVVLALIKRLTSKLPFYSGLALSDIEADDAVKMTIKSLVEVSRHAIDIIVWKLSEEIEKLARQTDSRGHHVIEVLQSQLFLLKVMSVTMAFRWYAYRNDGLSNQNSSSDGLDSAFEDAGFVHHNGTNGVRSSPIPSSSSGPSSLRYQQQSRYGKKPTSLEQLGGGGSSASFASSPYLDAPPLDENCARWLISVLLLLLRQGTPSRGDDRARNNAAVPTLGVGSGNGNFNFDTSLYGFESIEYGGGWCTLRPGEGPPSIQNGSSTNPHVSRKTPSLSSIHSEASPDGNAAPSLPLPLPKNALIFQVTPRPLTTSSSALHSLILYWAGRIVYLVSISNWNVVFARLRARINQLVQAPAASNSQSGPGQGNSPPIVASLGVEEGTLDLADLGLMQYCAIDRSRLIQVMQELNSLLVSMKAEAVAVVGAALRKAIHSFIEVFPQEYAEVAYNTRKLDGAPMRTFDLLHPYAETTVTTRTGMAMALWPILNLLFILSPDRQILFANSTSWNSGPTPATKTKEAIFIELIVKNLDVGIKLDDVCMLCCTDCLRAAIRLPRGADAIILAYAPDVSGEVKRRVIKASGDKPFYDVAESIDVTLYSEALVAIFRFEPEEEAIDIIYACLEPERSEAVKLCAAKALCMLAVDAPRLPNQPSLANLIPRVAHRLRSILSALLCRRPEIDKSKNSRRPASKPVSKRFTSDPTTDRELLVYALMALFRSDPNFLFTNCTLEYWHSWIPDTLQLLQPPNDLNLALTAIHNLRLVARWTKDLKPDHPFYELTKTWLSYVAPEILLRSSNRLLDARNDFEEQRLCIELARSILQVYAFPEQWEVPESWKVNSACLPVMAVVESAFLVSLTSSDTWVSQMAARGLNEIVLAEQMVELAVSDGIPEDDRARRYPVYSQLGDHRALAVGRVAQQKRIRKLLRALASPCPMHMAVWLECYWRWKALHDFISGQSQEEWSPDHVSIKHVGDKTMSSDDKLNQWHNLTLFLASFGAACCADQVDSQGLTLTIPVDFLTDRFRVIRDVEESLHDFMGCAVDLLLSDTLNVREIAKEALGTELSPRLYIRLFKHLNSLIVDVVKEAKESEHSSAVTSFLLFFEQSLSVMKSIVDRLDFSSEDLLGTADLMPTLLSLAKVIDRFSSSSASYCARIKIKLCAFCDSILVRSDDLGLRKDDAARNALLEVIAEWIQTAGNLTIDDDDSTFRSQYDASIIILKAVVRLLDHLKLDAVESYPGDDITHTVSRRFGRFQNLLIRAFSFIKSGDFGEEDNVSLTSSTSKRKNTAEKETEIRDLIIAGLANLISANSEIGFKHSLALAQDEEPRKRAIFCHAVARVLVHGTRFETPSNTALVVRRGRLCELVKGSDMILILAICETCPPSDVDTMIPIILNLCENRASIILLLKAIIEREVKETADQKSLFRGNSMRVRLLCAFAKLHGYDYLRSILKPLIDQMCSFPEECNFELDPARAAGQDIRRNQEAITVLAKAFLDVICASAPALPPMLREVCGHISKTVADVWKESKFAALGAFIFLRFISPTLVSPDSVDIELPQENIGIRRGLLAVAKIIQNLANNVLFGKENHMICFNEFLNLHIVRITKFLSDVIKHSATGTENEPDEWVGGSFDDTDAIVLHRFYEKHLDKVGKELLSHAKPSADGEANTSSGKKAWDTLCATLVDMGPPIEVPQLNMLNAVESPEYINFLNRNEQRDGKSVRDLVDILIPVKGQTAFLVILLWKFDVDVLDFELLLFRAYELLRSPGTDGRSFEVVLDCTDFTSSSEVPLQWFKFSVEIIPKDIRERFTAVHILNPNVLLQRYLRKLYNVCAGITIPHDIRIYTSVEDLCQRVSDDLRNSLPASYSLEKEGKESFRDVTLRQGHSRSKVHLDVATSHLRITSVKAHGMFASISSKAVDIISMSDVGDIYNISVGRDANEFIIRRSRNGGALYFSSPDRERIVKAIRSAKGRARSGMAPSLDKTSRLSNASATLLNIAMINISCEDIFLHSAAFDLLSAVSTSLNIEDNSLLPSKAGFIPGRPSSVVILLSEKLAASAPKLTLDFLSEACLVFSKCTISQRMSCLQYMSPWVKNFPLFCNPTNSLYEQSGARLRDCIKLLLEITMHDKEVYAMIQKHVWTEIGKLDSVVTNVVLEELMRTAVDGGLNSSQCDAMADTMGAISSLNIRSRLLAKIRKTLGKTSIKPTKRLPDNPHWNEISVYMRLALVTGNTSKQILHNQIFVPEVAHVVSLLSATGDTTVRISSYGLSMNLLQSLHAAKVDDSSGAELRALLDEFAQPEVLSLFGLVRSSSTSEYSNFSVEHEHVALESLENLVRLLLKILKIGAGNTGLANIWRARWMSLLTAVAFQLSTSIQPRAFIVMGTLASADVDDDLLYQMLVALKSSMRTSDESDTLCIVSMLRCICNAIPGLPASSRYLQQMFWLGVALLQSSHVAFYKEANRILCASLETMRRQNMFKRKGFIPTLIDARIPLEDISLELDQILGVSFESNFSLSLASVIFKGFRRPQLRDSAVVALQCLVRITVSTLHEDSSETPSSLHSDILGYFLALLSVSTTIRPFQQLLKDSAVTWPPDVNGTNIDRFESDVPCVPLTLLGCNDTDSALLIASFLSGMLMTAQGDDAESQILFTLLSDIASTFPEVVSIMYETIQEKINDAFSNSSNAKVLSAASNIFRVAMEDLSRRGSALASVSSFGTAEDVNTHGPGPKHLAALQKLNMQGLAYAFQFLPSNGGHATKVLNWFPELISRILE